MYNPDSDCIVCARFRALLEKQNEQLRYARKLLAVEYAKLTYNELEQRYNLLRELGKNRARLLNRFGEHTDEPHGHV